MVDRLVFLFWPKIHVRPRYDEQVHYHAKETSSLHDNAPAHRTPVVCEFLTEKQIPMLAHQPYSPDLLRCNYFSFSILKVLMKGALYDHISTR
ncbi:hypothetical protein WH47_04440 [Habropoda laboriosa]|uniref:Histone-lysine N-methyltransferase SETMAR n=1 Tax=Habropoda laboriosa TaxID=597456 RepID=A0A0L7QWS0_9HYME|nr:hypothetical protein WH47_04440 [Habropoda laboriosa]